MKEREKFTEFGSSGSVCAGGFVVFALRAADPPRVPRLLLDGRFKISTRKYSWRASFRQCIAEIDGTGVRAFCRGLPHRRRESAASRLVSSAKFTAL